jgi:hypothetical protein
MILFRYYDKDKRIDKAWYDSSNIIYSECDDNENDFKTLRIVFKRGDMYEYSKVDVKDYLMFMAGGIDGSNGKAFHKFILPKYEAKKLEHVDLNALNDDLEALKAKKLKEKKEVAEKDTV